MRVPLVDLAAQEAPIAAEVLTAIARVAQKGRFVLGEHVDAFEGWLSGACGADHAVGVASGTDAIELSLRALGVSANDAVITPALSFVAAAEAIAATGARPVFCDVEPGTMNASVATVEEAIGRARRSGWNVRALVPVHLFGRCAPIAAMRAMAARDGIVVIEDAAQAIGARDEAGRPAGGIGDAGCLSFFPTKGLGAWGDAGAVVTSRSDVATRLRRLRAHGAVEPYVHAEAGRNSRLDALQAAVLLAKTRYLPDWQRARSRLSDRYRSELARWPLVLPAPADSPGVHAWHAFVVRTTRRDALARALGLRGIETRVYYPVPLHRQPCFAWLDEPQLPVAEEICRTALALPVFPAMSDEQQEFVVEQVRQFFEA
jgi:dTDP-4-amino-4,6-dideoxygalactose transaminase